MTPHDWDEVYTPAEARAVLEALGVLDHDGSVVVRGTPVGLGGRMKEEQEEQGEPLGWVFWRRPGQWRERRWRWRWECDQRGLCPTLGVLADDVGCAGPLGHALCGGSTCWQGREVCPLPGRWVLVEDRCT